MVFLGGNMIIAMLSLHIFADFYLQTDESVQKKTNWKEILTHSFHHFLITLVVALGLTMNLTEALKISTGILVTHFAIDYWKQRKEILLNSKATRFSFDQLLHIVVIYLVSSSSQVDERILAITLGRLNFTQIVEIVLYILILVKPINVLIRIIFEDMRSEFGEDPEVVNIHRDKKDDDETGNGVAKGGRFIGIIERISILMMILTGNSSFIGYFLGFKVASRWEQIKTTEHFSEKFFVGTLISLLVTTLIGIRIVHLIK